MIKTILVFVLVCILVFPLSLTAQERKGADLIIWKLDGEYCFVSAKFGPLMIFLKRWFVTCP
ncbi:hypothetical protein ACFLR7_05265, partial [Acidobacteriota bacterium]